MAGVLRLKPAAVLGAMIVLVSVAGSVPTAAAVIPPDAVVEIVSLQFLPPDQPVADWSSANPVTVLFENQDGFAHWPHSGIDGAEDGCFDAGVIEGGESFAVEVGCFG